MMRQTPWILAVVVTSTSVACGARPSSQERLAPGPVELVGVPSRPLNQVLPVDEAVKALPSLAAVAGCATVNQALRLLVLSATGDEVDLPSIRQALDYHAIPYTVWIATQRPGQLTASELASGCSGNYQGVILTTGGLPYTPDGGATWLSALSANEWRALRDYEAGFGVREITWYTFPGADQGLTAEGAVDTSTTPIDATWTAEGASLFPYLVSTTPVSISMAWTYLAVVSDPSVTVLLADDAGHALASTRVFSDGRETLSLTFDSNPYLRHAVLLSHGLVEWVTRGTYLGEFRAYLTPQVDDLFLDNDLYSGGVYRMTAADLNAAAAWQSTVQAGAGNGAVRLAWAFNGEGGNKRTDPLTKAVKARASKFVFINHTWDHENLDAATGTQMSLELTRNRTFASSVGIKAPTSTLVTPDVSGLTNRSVLRAAASFGVRWVVSDTSRTGWDNPAPNVGIQSTLESRIYFVPRRPTNLFYNVSRPAEWTDEYNAFYRAYWGRDLTYQEILDKESDVLLQYMLRGEIDPQMYHQANLRLYDGRNSLLADLLGLAIQKFRGYTTLPLSSPDLEVSGARMKATGARSAAGLTAYRTPGVGVTLSSPVALRVSVSGPCTEHSETYAGKCITSVSLSPNVQVTLPVP